mmetsp:Transcript_87846/g.268821  ORF Transcript_87846/g.268821 Transcript_87846/m.268821 type:complete len:334 (+) Transcript_87846:2583-3584(+)
MPATVRQSVCKRIDDHMQIESHCSSEYVAQPSSASEMALSGVRRTLASKSANSSGHRALTKSMSGTASTAPAYKSSLATRMSSLKWGMSTVMPGMYGALKGFGIGRARQRARLPRRQRASAFASPAPWSSTLPTAVSEDMARSMPALLHLLTGRGAITPPRPPSRTAPSSAASASASPKECFCAASGLHLSSRSMCSMIRSHTAGKASAYFCPGLQRAKAKTFLEKRSGIFGALRSNANRGRCAKMLNTPRTVQAIWYHRPVSATNKKKPMDQSNNHNNTSKPQAVLYQKRLISSTGSRPKVTKSSAAISCPTDRRIVRDTSTLSASTAAQKT